MLVIRRVSSPPPNSWLRRHWWRAIPLAIAVFCGRGTLRFAIEARNNTTGGSIPVLDNKGEETGYYEDVGPDEYRREMETNAIVMGIATLIAAAVTFARVKYNDLETAHEEAVNALGPLNGPADVDDAAFDGLSDLAQCTLFEMLAKNAVSDHADDDVKRTAKAALAKLADQMSDPDKGAGASDG